MMATFRHKTTSHERATPMTHVPQSEPTFVAIAATMLHRRVPTDQIARLVYLIDWKSAIEDGRQATGIVWTVNDQGNLDFAPVIRELDVVRTAMRGIRSMFDMLRNLDPEADIPEDVRAAYDHVWFVAKPMNRVDLEILVKSTYPCLTALAGDPPLDLPALAVRYAELMAVAAA